jgi:hypothetical protein
MMKNIIKRYASKATKKENENAWKKPMIDAIRNETNGTTSQNRIFGNATIKCL